ncbi:MAG: hypothetical protein R3207_00175 [Oceanospirillum sp.]|nr:hypothetical protein [Oceanospirillum sp.]
MSERIDPTPKRICCYVNQAFEFKPAFSISLKSLGGAKKGRTAPALNLQRPAQMTLKAATTITITSRMPTYCHTRKTMQAIVFKGNKTKGIKESCRQNI